MAYIKQVDSSHQRKDVVIRADCNKRIGSGHIVRCSAIADAAVRRGASVFFVVSDEESAASLRNGGIDCMVLEGDCMKLHAHDGQLLGSLCCEVGASSVLVDTYAVNNAFFEALNNAIGDGCRVAWIDDWYTYELGEQTTPIARQVDCVANYSLGMNPAEYEAAYAGTKVELCVSPRFAPLRPQFSPYDNRVYGALERIMVTTGSTNDSHLLEQMTEACLEAVPDAQVDVIVGSMAEFIRFDDSRVVEHRGVTDLAPFKRASDLCVCAAGTTPYELSAIGVPSIAIPTVDNQRPNAAGFKQLGLGFVVDTGARMRSELIGALEKMAANPKLRGEFVAKMHEAVDGRGAERIARKLY